MAKIIKPGKGIPCKCTGNTGYGGNGCGATVGVYPDDLFNVTSMVPGGDVNKAFRCPQCGTTSDLETNRVKTKSRGTKGLGKA